MKLAACLLVFLLLIGSVCALSLPKPNLVKALPSVPVFGAVISVKDSFSEGQDVKFDFAITSDIDRTVTYTPYISCENVPLPFLESKQVFIGQGKTYKGTYEGFTVTPDVDSQACIASLTIEDPATSVKKQFSIVTKPRLDFSFRLDKFYHLGDVLHLDKKGETVTGFVVFPDKSQISIDNLNINLNQPGTYRVNYNIQKTGYKPFTRTDVFSVLGENPTVTTKSVCNADLKCEAGENYKNCPQDCLKPAVQTKNNLVGQAYNGAFVNVNPLPFIFAALLVIVIFFYIKGRKRT